MQGIEIKMSPNKGRGVFASKDLAADEILIIETPIVHGETHQVINHQDSRERRDMHETGKRELIR